MIHQCRNKLMKSCSYIIWEKFDGDCYIIDCGEFNIIQDFLIKFQLHPKGVFLTHCHFDHIYGLNELVKIYPNCCIYASKETIEGLYDEL